MLFGVQRDSDAHLKSESCTLKLPPAITKQQYFHLIFDASTICGIHRFSAIAWLG